MTTTKTWLIANWKMHGSHQRVRAFAYEVNHALAAVPETLAVVFCPPFTYLETARSSLPLNAELFIGGQNCAKDPEGAFTGGISAPMLADCGASYVIIGHSERRQHMHETNEQVCAKVQAAFDAGLTPIICIGETAEEYSAGKTTAALDAQLKAIGPLKGEALIAYEPVWAIGSGKTPTVAEIGAAHSHIKTTLGSAIHVLYGGSVKPANIHEILSIPSVSGALIGGASLEIEGMKAMITAATELGKR